MTTPRGKIREVTSFTNPEIKALKALHQKKHRAEADAFLAEGLKLAIDALDQGWAVRQLLIAKSHVAEPLVAKTVRRVLDQGGDVLTVPAKLIGAVTKRDNPQTVVAAIGRKQGRFEDLPAPEPTTTLVALDRVRDPGNLGTIIRTADAAGVSAVVLVGDCVDPFAIETVRATMGSLFAIPIIRTDEAGLSNFTKASGYQLVGSHLKGARDYRDIDYKAAPTILLMGNEQSGLTDSLAETCDALALIPQVGGADSLNLAVATALMIYEARRETLSRP